MQCLDTPDCADETVCGPGSFACIESLGLCNPDDPPCSPEAPFCFDGYCVACLSGGDCRCPADDPGCNRVCYRFACLGDDFCERVTCPEGTRCIPDARACVETGRCQQDSDCGGGRRCDQERQVCYYDDGRCYHNGDCPANLVCNLDTHLCEGPGRR